MKEIEVAQELTIGLLERMGVHAEVEGFVKDGDICLDIKGDQEGILIGKDGRTLESLQMLIRRMVDKALKNAARVVLDVDGYRKRRAESLIALAQRVGEKVKRTGQPLTIGPFSAHDRRTIHITFKEDPSLETESLGEGELKKVRIIPVNKAG